MKMKRALSLILVLVLIFAGTVGASAAEAGAAEELTLEQRINRLELTPKPVPDWAQYHTDWYDFSRINRVVNDQMTNYEKLQAVFLDVAQNSPTVTSCTSQQMLLTGAFDMLGFTTWEVNGLTRSKGGGLPFTYGSVPEGWCTHSWVAIEIDGQPQENIILWGEGRSSPRDIELGYGYDHSVVGGAFLYFDSNLYATYGMDFSQCFAVQPKDATWYQHDYFYMKH